MGGKENSREGEEEAWRTHGRNLTRGAPFLGKLSFRNRTFRREGEESRRSESEKKELLASRGDVNVFFSVRKMNVKHAEEARAHSRNYKTGEGVAKGARVAARRESRHRRQEPLTLCAHTFPPKPSYPLLWADTALRCGRGSGKKCARGVRHHIPPPNPLGIARTRMHRRNDQRKGLVHTKPRSVLPLQEWRVKGDSIRKSALRRGKARPTSSSGRRGLC